MTLVGNAYDDRMTKYLDVVGKIHTPKSGNKQIDVPLVQMNAMLGLLSDILMKTICDLGLGRDQERQASQAFNKLLWIQNDLVNRHYATGKDNGTPAPAESSPTSAWR
jgi:hypothetical protein